MTDSPRLIHQSADASYYYLVLTPPMVTLTEVLSRAEQGRTVPFVCRGDDGQSYYVKGRHAGYHSLCCEWVGSCLARSLFAKFGLTLPKFVIAEVPRALIEGSARSDIHELGKGSVFASCQVQMAREINWEDVQSLSPYERAVVLFLDLWIQNGDRTLSQSGGNPNLLITDDFEIKEGDETGGREKKLWVIDFNLAFDEKFDRSEFFGNHIFASLVKAWPPGFQDAVMNNLPRILEDLRGIFNKLPDDWLYLDGDSNLGVYLDQTKVYNRLSLPLIDPQSFWTLS